jgi:hypothetical protein
MPRNFRAAIKEPRIVMRAIIGVLLAANLVAAVIAFKPFGGSADDLRQEQMALTRQLTQLRARVAARKRIVDKVDLARREGDDFLAKYFTDRRTTSSTVMGELGQMADQAGMRPRTGSAELNQIEGSDTLEWMSITVGYEGTYASLEKLVNLLDKSPRFLIIENMQASPQQNSQTLTVTLKLDTFVKEMPGGTS